MTTAELVKQGEVIFDLRNKLRKAEAENAELKKVLKAQVVAACNDRITALEEAARPFVNQWNGKGPATREHYKRLAEVLEKGN